MKASFAAACALALAVQAKPLDVKHRHHARQVVETAVETAYVTVVATNDGSATTYSTPVAAQAVAASSSAAPASSSSAAASSVAQESSATPASTSSATQSSASASSSSSSSGSGKRGLAWDQANPDSEFSTIADDCSWFYNWGASSNGLSGPTFVPTAKTDGLGSLSSDIEEGCTLLGFNEPDNDGQTNIDVSTAVSLYKESITPLKDSGKISYLGTPSTTNGDNGPTWMQNFMDSCSDCGIDFVNVHWYGTEVSELKSYIEEMHSSYPDYKIWLTEFACTNWDTSALPSYSEVYEFLKESVSWLEDQDYVEKYAWFGATTDIAANVGANNELLADSNGDLSDLGKLYVSL